MDSIPSGYTLSVPDLVKVARAELGIFTEYPFLTPSEAAELIRMTACLAMHIDYDPERLDADLVDLMLFVTALEFPRFYHHQPYLLLN